MRLNQVLAIILPVFVASVSAQWGQKEFKTGDVLKSGATGPQGDYYVEFWRQYDSDVGVMTLGDDCDFSCEWGQNENILFRKGLRPGSWEQIINYTADYQPQSGVSYLSVYGWFKNKLVEYYIIESWGSWRPTGTHRGTVKTDGGTYDIYETTRREQPSIEGTKTFQQYWSVRTQKRTEGTITCANHFDAWKKAGMQIGTFYEVSFNVEAYRSPGGKADVKVSMTLPTGVDGGNSPRKVAAMARSTGGSGRFRVTGNSTQTITFSVPVAGSVALKVFDYLGREVAVIPGRDYSAGEHSVAFDASRLARGIYCYTVTGF